MSLFDRIFNRKPRIKIDTKPTENPAKKSDNDDVEFFIDTHVSIINMNLRGMADKVAKQKNSDLIKHHLNEVFNEAFDLGYSLGKNDRALDKLKNETSSN